VSRSTDLETEDVPEQVTIALREIAGAAKEGLRIVECADTAGFETYHLAEHHGTPLGLAPSPNLFLSAVAARTRRIRLGPLVCILPLYRPLRLAEEIAMLDQLSRGRLDLGIGRGASPLELSAFGIEPSDSRAMLEESLQIVLMALSRGSVDDFEGSHFQIRNAAIAVRPVQKPYAPLWYPTARAESIPWAARHGMNFLDAFPSALLEAGDNHVIPVARYEREFTLHRCDENRLNGHVSDPRRGFIRHVVVAETDAEAEAIAKPAYALFADHFNWLSVRSGGVAILRMSYDEFKERGFLVAGSANTVRRHVAEQLVLNGGNYFVGVFTFGNLSTTDVTRSVTLFGRDVMPRLGSAASIHAGRLR
jgi:alkanesulfonate monooxygenase SsuD/methylene tetrahydromethanopterin reductase-like flavin-dependent oxidoreductase (luciferase family)